MDRYTVNGLGLASKFVFHLDSVLIDYMTIIAK